MNKKGFTLVELIAMMVVIGILMAITIPNISGIIKKNREDQAIEDVNKMVSNVKAKLDSGKVEKPNVNECVVFTLKSADTNDDIGAGLNGGVYDPLGTFVVAARKPLEGEAATSSYKYYIHLYETKDEGGNRSVFMTTTDYGDPTIIDYDDFVNNPEDNFPKLVTGEFTNRLDTENYETNLEEMKEILNNVWEDGDLCSKVLAVYIK